MPWAYDRETGWHVLNVDANGDEFVFVYKTAAGDYAISAMREGDAAGGDVDYRDTLKQAKDHGEQLKASGDYRMLMLEQL